jgi:hypothetical protein
MPFSVMTARRGWATAADVVNARPLASVLSRCDIRPDRFRARKR